ncbi:MAG TPA: hypothetical protein VGT40_04630 [Methylomirabilota bacterium]|jgi:hypothetical protein|nr:hypothetical protein [Methylomirabilota bacterium]
MTRPSRISRGAILSQLKQAARKGDRVALSLATEQMKTWAYSPRYWQKYLELLAHPLARLVDMLLIKQGEKIARQKGWVKPKRPPRKASPPRPPVAAPRGRRAGPLASAQPSLFPDLGS